MRPGPARGETATLEIVVTQAMTARVAGQEIHPVYGTAALVQHIEEVCRTILLPHLEAGEEGVGHRMDVTQRAPVPVGATVVLTASVAAVGPQELTCEVLARSGSALVARGSFTQKVVDLATFRASYESGAAVG